jgi:hypothetical protein
MYLRCCFRFRDEDEMEERIEELNKRGLAFITKSTGYTKAERKKRLTSCRSFLSEIWNDESREDDDVILEFMTTTIEKQYRRLYGYEVEVPFDVISYLEKENYSDDEEEEGDEGDEEEVEGEKKKEKENEEKMISLSDSEDENEEEDKLEGGDDELGNITDHSISPLQPSKLTTTINIPVIIVNRVETPSIAVTTATISSFEQMKKQFRKQLNNKFRSKYLSKQSRTQLLLQLRENVREIAKENYCSHKKINKDSYHLQLEISEKCR